MVGLLSILIIKFIRIENIRVGCILGNSERFLSPNCRIDNLPQGLHLISVLIDHTIGYIFQSGQILQIHRSDDMPRIILKEIGSCIPESMEIAGRSIGQDDLLPVAANISIGIGHIEQRNRVQRLMDVANKMHNISGKKSSLSRVMFHILSQHLVGSRHHHQRTKCIFSVVDDRHNSIDNIGTIFEMIGIEKFHIVRVPLDIIRPARRLYKCSTFVVAEFVYRCHQVPEVHRCVGIQLVQTDLGYGCCQHVSYVPPADC